MKAHYSRRNTRSGRRTRPLPDGQQSLDDDRCTLYIRASTADQKNSLDAQEHEGRLFATRNGRQIDGVFIDPGVSGSKPFLQRKEAKRAITHMKHHGITTLLVLKLDRAFRNLPDMRATLDHLMAEGLTLRVINPDIDFKGSIGLLIANILGAIAEFELGCRGERQRDGIEVMRRKRVSRSQHAPFGWDLGPELPDEKSHAGRPLRQLLPNEREQQALREIIALYERNETLQAIADRLNSDNIPTKQAGKTMKRTVAKGTPNEHVKIITCSGQWKPQTVKSVLDYAELADSPA
jgi:DNA invertase Pin-like site-specific DNA recombinase